jgi:hydroxymethylpyrimidine/phosphomethylpyrimidine kinase
MIPVALSIAGSDPSGGAGVQADLKTFHQLRVFGTAAITLITVQNTTRVSRVETLDPTLVVEQITAVLEDMHPRAAKTGAMGTAAIIEAVGKRWREAPPGCPLVVDPVMISKHGAPLMEAGARKVLRDFLIPQAALVTPNLPEASALSEMDVQTADEMKEAAIRIARAGSRSLPVSVLIKGGHLGGAAFEDETLDILYHHGVFREFRARRVDTRHTHGTGCTYSAAITAFLARGLPMEDAVACAKRFIDEAIRTAPGLGAGSGPLNHWADARPDFH